MEILFSQEIIILIEERAVAIGAYIALLTILMLRIQLIKVESVNGN